MARQGKKVLTVIAVEVHAPRGLGRCRISPLADASGESLHRFVMDHVEPGATIVTDGWPPYQGLGATQLRMIGAARAPPELGATIRTSCCPPCTALSRWSRDGCWGGPTMAPTTKPTCSVTSMSSCFAATADAPAPVVWCSSACLNWRSVTSRCACRISSRTGGRGRSHPCRRNDGDTPPASSVRMRNDRGEGPPCTPVKWIPQIQRIRPGVPVDKRAPAKHPNRVQLTFDAQTCRHLSAVPALSGTAPRRRIRPDRGFGRGQSGAPPPRRGRRHVPTALPHSRRHRGDQLELKRQHGLGDLRVRGRPRVVLAVHLNATACNLKRMVRALPKPVQVIPATA